MRKYRLSILVFVLVALCAVSAGAREISFGAKAGLLMSNVTGTPEDWEDNQSYRTALGGGIFLNYAFDESFSLQPELLYTSKGFTGNLYEGIVSVDATLSFDYVELPVLAKYTFNPGGALHPFVCAGPSIAFCLTSDLDVSVGWFGGSVDISSLSHTTDFCLIAGGGLGYDAGDGMLTLDARFYRGFTNAITTGDFLVNGSTETLSVDDFKNYGFAFFVGYQF